MSLSDHQDSEHFSYARTWDEIENMLYAAERKQNYWVNTFYKARESKDKSTMKEAARNKKALEGVIKTLRWTLGDIHVSHPLE